jgi:hypothetical protein
MVDEQYKDWKNVYRPDRGDYLVLSIQVRTSQHVDFEIQFTAISPEPPSETLEQVLLSLAKIKLNLHYIEKAARYVAQQYPQGTFQLIESGILVDGLTDEQIVECIKVEDIKFAVVVVS